MSLKKCPKCGATIFEERGPMLKKVKSPEKYKFYYMVQCQKCQTKTDLFGAEADAVKDWNHKSIEAMRENEGVRLKPCPFCGANEHSAGRPAVITETLMAPYGYATEYAVRCHRCGAQTDWYPDEKEDAAEAWNRRDGEGETK